MGGGSLYSEKRRYGLKKIILVFSALVLAVMLAACSLEVTDSVLSDFDSSYGKTTSAYVVEDGQLYEVTVRDLTGEIISKEPVPDSIVATPETAQAVFDSDISGKLVYFDRGTYGSLELRPSKNDVTAYRRSGTQVPVDQLESTGVYTYIRNIDDVHFLASDEAVFTGSFRIRSTHIYGDGNYDAVREVECVNTTTSYYSQVNLNRVWFENMKFSGESSQFNFGYYNDAAAHDVTFIRCSFSNNDSDLTSGGGVAAIRLAADNSGKYNDITVDSCCFSSCYQGVYIQCGDGIEVINSDFDGTEHNAIAVQSSTDSFSGSVVIRNNHISNTNDRAVRFGKGSEAEIEVSGNAFSNAADTDGQLLKSETLTSCTYSFSSNTYDGQPLEDVSGEDSSWTVTVQ